MKTLLNTLILLFLIQPVFAQQKPLAVTTKFDTAIAVLNMGSFHMGFTSDANKTEFDEHSAENVRQVHAIAKAIAAFKPTVILVERPVSYNAALQHEYAAYLKNQKMKFEHPSEIELLAYEIGRLSNTQRIYGVDYKQGYNYMIGNFIKYKDTTTVKGYMRMLDVMGKQYPEDKMTVLDHLKMANHPQYLDMLININADILTHISTEGKAEGAEEAAKFYHRNLVMYSNINQIELKKDDRVFILMGATHTAFFNMWLQRSPRYKPVNVLDYLDKVK
jgi:hypothetical protein